MNSAPVDPEVLLELIDKLYAAAVEPGLWKDFLSAFTRAAGSTGATFVFHHANTLAGFSAQVGYSEDFLRGAQEYWSNRDIYYLSAKPRLHSGWVGQSEQYVPEKVLLASDFYNDFAKQEDIFYNCGAVVEYSESRSIILTTHRARRAGPFDENHVELLRQLSPHLQRAVGIHGQMTGLRNMLQSLECAVDRASRGIVFVDAKRKVLFANARARDLFASHNGVWLEHGTIVACGLRQNEKLQRAIDRSAQTGTGKATHSGVVLRIDRNNAAHPLVITVTPFPNRAGVTPQGTCAALFITDLEANGDDPGFLLETVYGLTPAEKRLASILSSGCTLEQTAEQMQIQRSTAVSHLKSIFSKTNTNRQSELLRLLTILNSHAKTAAFH
ncbi:MAG TPA: helix-turn-helix transcriptional regulator [Terriglobales bacterium]|nr:helix-turn-helix transcriptional regulator [Terriglobales bacterium]